MMGKPATEWRHIPSQVRKLLDLGTEKNEMYFAFTNLGLKPKARDVSPLRGWLFGAAMSMFIQYENARSQRFLQKITCPMTFCATGMLHSKLTR